MSLLSLEKKYNINIMRNFENKVVCITGADGGIGREITKKFASEGATLILTSIAESDEFSLFIKELIDSYIEESAEHNETMWRYGFNYAIMKYIEKRGK